MAKETLRGAGEIHSSAPELLERSAAEAKRNAAERLEKLSEREPTSAEKAQAEAREQLGEALEQVESQQKTAEEADKQPQQERGLFTKADRQASFNNTMKVVQSQLSSPSRAFSKVIHNPTVEKVSEVTGKTIARPNAILAGSITAFVFTLAIYTLAKINGYPLSGAETIATFFGGWVVGIIIDILRVAISRNRHKH